MASVNANRANPAPLGLFAFGLTTVFLFLVNTGILPAGGEAVVIPMAFAFGGTIQTFAGIFEFCMGNTFGLTVFMSFGAFWWWFALLFVFTHNGILDASGAGPSVGACLLLWGVLTTGFWISSFSKGWVLCITFLAAVLAFFLLGLGKVLPSSLLASLGNWDALLTGALALYCGVAILTNGTYDREVLPMGVVKSKPDSKLAEH